ncbi:MAG: chromosome segregation protein SMC [Paracoccus denitrificans]|nr:MAG: chromosome segregation protein SMC [Paracoccus denitrificans]PZO84913.1 MAG: chromosome segregation protein SMC [Paracoccus denitrificans]
MRFDRLRLNGFKSFVDPTELVIREGLTGVVGPNGCGKSNLLEALRWVMGENRPTAMRGDGMEDVIFAGTTRRPARNVAEVALTIDNTARLAPAAVNDADQLDISRRITRDAGSAYRVNGKEVRARDVQMLFADASTGSHSPALVRQGQISELINAKPKARRRILEEAAGISGLYQRRHEAELRLGGAETNLTRVDDTLDQLSAQAAALARQARAAAKYREIGAALRAAESALLYRRWVDADAALAAATQALVTVRAQTAAAEAAARTAVTARAQAETALPPLREDETIAAAILSRLDAERTALDQAATRAAEAIRTLTGRLAQLDRDLDREANLNRDADDVMTRLSEERSDLEQAGIGHDERVRQADAAAGDAATDLRDLEIRVSELTDESAKLSARHQSAERLVTDLRAMRDRAGRQATDAEAAVTRSEAAGRDADAARQAAAAAQTAATTELDAAEAALTAAEAARTGAESVETRTRAARAEAEGEAAALAAEQGALARLVERGRSGGPTLLDQIKVAPGFEAALGAALGDDLRLPPEVDGQGWRALLDYDDAAPLPADAQSLADVVTAPPVLARRLSQTGIAADLTAARSFQASLRPGQRLVTQAGDLVRWDGLIVAAGQNSAAALHLQQVNRLADLTQQSDAATARAAAAIAAHDTARPALTDATRAETAARDARRTAERALSDAARTATRAESDVSLAIGRVDAARNELARHTADAADAARRLSDAEAALAVLPDPQTTTDALTHARQGVEAMRIATMSRRTLADDLRRDGIARAKRMADIEKESAGWAARLEQATTRSAELTARREQTAAELAAAEDEPARLSNRRAELDARAADATARVTAARTALAGAESALLTATMAERDTERAASDAREQRATFDARADAAREVEVAARARITEETAGTPQDLSAQITGPLPATQTLESDIARLRAQRDAIGPVNLRADEDKRLLEEERATLAAEKDDLTEAIRKLRAGIGSLNREGRERLLAAFETVNASFATLFVHLFGGGEARLTLVESDDPLEAGLEILCQPPGKKLSTLSLLSGGEQTLTALALISAVFLANPAPICVLDEVDAPLDDANVGRFCDLLDEMTRRTDTRFLIITHHAVTMGRMDRLFGVTMVEQGVSQLVSVDLKRAEALVA